MPDLRINSTILDDFNYAAQTPLTGSPAGNWAQMDGARNPLNSNGSKAVVGVSGTCYSYWTPLQMDGDEAQVWAYSSGGGASGQLWGLVLCQQPGGSSAADGYHFRLSLRSGGGSDAFLERFTNMSFTILDSTNIHPLTPKPASNGEQIWLLRRNGTSVEGWFSNDLGASWIQSLSAVDTTYTTGLYACLVIAGTLVAWDYFGAGAKQVFLPQIYRRPLAASI